MRARCPRAIAASLAASLLSQAPAAAAPQTHVVVIDKMKFGSVPARLRKGDSIVWLNKDMFRHTATAANKSFDVDLPPSSKRVTLLKADGTIQVVCRYHPGMRTTLKVGK